MRTASLLAGASCLALVICGQAAAQTPSEPGPGDQTAGDGPTLGEVIVTASRREISVRKTPTAVSAYGGAQLKEAQITSLTELTALSPNIQIGTFATAANVSIRGIGNTQLSAAGSDPGVAVSQDGVYLGQSGLVVSTFLDVSRVEILRGPQGTLFGRNATGGAINIIPNTPTADLHYGVDATAGADPTLVRSSAFVSGPLTAGGEVRGRFAAQQNYDRGHSKNLLASGPQRLDGVNTYGARAQLQWEPSSTVTARLLLEHQGQDDAGPAQYLVGTPDPSVPVPGPILGAPRGNINDRSTYANQADRRQDTYTANLITDVDLSGGNLKLLLSFNKTDQHTDSDGDGTPVDFTDSQFTVHAHQYFAEAIYTSPSDQPLTYVLGANYYSEEARQGIRVPVSFLPVAVFQGGTLDTRSYAAFGQTSYEITEGFKAFAGARYTHDHKSVDEFNNYMAPSTLSQGRSWSRLTYEAGLTYDFSPSISGYVKYAKGYKGGGFSVGSLAPPFAPETNTNVEAGLKGAFFHGHLQANLSAFHMKYNDLQVTQVVGVASRVTNAAKATIDGVEIESVLRPTDRLRLNLSAAWLDARFDQFMTEDSARPALGGLDLKGNRLPQAPRFNASLGAYYEARVPSGTVTLGARFDWKSKLYFSEFNIPVSSQGAAGKLDLSVLYEDAAGRWTASLFATNVTDEKIKSNTLVVSAVLGSLSLAVLQPGRQVGVALGCKF